VIEAGPPALVACKRCHHFPMAIEFLCIHQNANHKNWGWGAAGHATDNPNPRTIPRKKQQHQKTIVHIKSNQIIKTTTATATAPGIVADDGREPPERRRKRLDRELALPLGARGDLVDRAGHPELGHAGAPHDARLVDGLCEHAERVVDRALGLVENVARRPAEHDRAGLAALDAREADQRLLADHDLLDEVGLAEHRGARLVKGARDLAARHEREPLNARKVGVLNRRDAGLGKDRLAEVVDQLPVHHHVAPRRDHRLDLGAHLGPLGDLDRADGRRGVGPHARAKDLDLVRVHRSVDDQDLGLLNALRLPDANLLLKQEALVWGGIIMS
jgi:hypothetical protein